MSGVLVPDSIEPYLGWKVLTLSRHFDMFLSPQQDTIWRPQQRLEAKCTSQIHKSTKAYNYEWVAREGEAPPADLQFSWATTGVITKPTPAYWISSVDIPKALGGLSDPPEELLPEGQYWSWEPTGEEQWRKGIEIVHRRCSCGIYAVDDPDDLTYYLQSPRAVLVRVALWGRVIIGEMGARGQYAYPQQLLFPPGLHLDAERIAAKYGVPYLLRHHPFHPRRIASTATEKNVATEVSYSLATFAFTLALLSFAFDLLTPGNLWLIPFTIGLCTLALAAALHHVGVRR